MPRATPIQASLNAGEFSPRMAARTDFAKYPLACATLENMVPLPQGGAMRRPGTVFVAEVKDSSKRVRLMPFQYSTKQAYAIEAGEGYFRFYRDRGRVAAGDTDAAIANGTFDAGIAGWIDRSTGTASIAHDAANQRLSLAGASASEAWAEQAVTISPPYQSTEHVLRFRVYGAPGDTILLRLGTTSTGGEIVDDIDVEVGFHSVAFTPGAGAVYVQFRNAAAKTLGIDDVSFTAGAPVEIATPYQESQLAALKFAQSADTLYLCHGAHPVYKLQRYGDASWSLVRANFVDGPYLVENPTATTLTPSATTGLGITVTASAATGINDGKGFLDSDIGRLVRIKHGSVWGYAVITGVASTTVVTADVRRDFGAATAQPAWRLGEWSETTGFPFALAFFEQRLGFAATDIKPQTFWLSQSADIESFEPDSVPSGGGERQVEDDDALNFTIAADQVNVIRWISPGAKLILGTVGGEWQITSSGPQVTPTDIDVKRQTAFGSADVQPVIMRGRLVFLQRASRKLLEFSFSFEMDNFRALDQTLLADHVTKGGITELAYQQELDSTLWCVRADGQMPTLTFQPDQNVVGWARQIFGGGFAGSHAVAESVTIIPGANEDEVWVAVKRTIGGVTRRYVEYLHAIFETGDEQESAHFVDSGLALDNPVAITGATQTDPVTITAPGHGFANGAPVRITNVVGMTELNGNSYTVANATTNDFDLTDSGGAPVDGASFGVYEAGGEVREKASAVAGLDHLEGETVAILADGAIHPNKTVSGGTVALDYPASRVTAGLPYTHKYQSLKWEAGSATGTAQGQIKRIDGVTLVLLDSASSLVGPGAGRMKPISFRETDDRMDAAVPLFTGEKFVEFDGDYETDSRVHIQGDYPAPFFLLAVAPSLKTNNR